MHTRKTVRRTGTSAELGVSRLTVSGQEVFEQFNDASGKQLLLRNQALPPA